MATSWVNSTLSTTLSYTGTGSHTYKFRVQATDRAGNLSAWVESNQATVSAVGVRKYYKFGTQVIAERSGSNLYYLNSDHLSSTSLVTSPSGQIVFQARYEPYGQMRWSSGQQTTDKTFTGQRMDASFGLMNYNARYYDPNLIRWIQPDTIIPNPLNSLDYDRYSYTRNNPVHYLDPTGHWVETLLDFAFICYDVYQISQEGWTPVNTIALAADIACAVLPFATGGGAGVRVVIEGTETTAISAIRVPEAVRAAQGAEKILQFADDNSTNSPGKPPKKSYTSLEDAQRETENWGIEENLSHSDQSHLDAAKTEMTGGQVVPNKTYDHITEVRNSRTGLDKSLGYIENALKSKGWNEEARAYLMEQQKLISDRIDLIDQILGGN